MKVAALALALFIAWVVVVTLRDRRRQRQLAETRPPLDLAEFKRRLRSAGVEEDVAEFVWDEFQPYYFSPLTPYPEDRPISEMRIDCDDLSDMVTKFEEQFSRRWSGKWVGPDDPTLTEFAVALLASTTDK